MTPKASSSVSFRESWFSSPRSQSRISGITCCTSHRLSRAGHGLNLISPISGAVKIHHERWRRHGQTWSSLNSVWEHRSPVHLQNLAISAATKESCAAGATHSNTTAYECNSMAAFRVLVRLSDLEPPSPLQSPSRENGWQLNPELSTDAPLACCQIAAMVCWLPTSPTMPKASCTFECSETIWGFWSTATTTSKPAAVAPWAMPPKPQHTSITEWSDSHVGTWCPKVTVSLVALRIGTGACLVRQTFIRVKEWNPPERKPS